MNAVQKNYKKLERLNKSMLRISGAQYQIMENCSNMKYFISEIKSSRPFPVAAEQQLKEDSSTVRKVIGLWAAEPKKTLPGL
ncbi:hypothetical protein HWQ17_10970 [Enterobacter pasteurii]|uniref:hypothetical protein n=1 Tax=Enterobacter pasteurii TaxID=3029761 RepID=UPI0011DDFFBF|nr:hypothetical protein [Enterobacter pasteurii]QLA68126.1 hypothetical protein HWQ17_10970 [Enterobacter pasteurii]